MANTWPLHGQHTCLNSKNLYSSIKGQCDKPLPSLIYPGLPALPWSPRLLTDCKGGNMAANKPKILFWEHSANTCSGLGATNFSSTVFKDEGPVLKNQVTRYLGKSKLLQ